MSRLPPREGASIEAMLVPVALAELQAQISDVDSHDSKAFGLLGAILAAVALGLATKPGWTWWFIPGIVFILVALGALVWDLWPGRRVNAGPLIPAVYREMVAAPTGREANQVLLAWIQASFDENLPVLASKGRWLLAGIISAVVGVPYSGVIFVLVDLKVIHG